MRLAERLRTAIEQQAVPVPGAKELLRCTVTIGLSHAFRSPDGFDAAMQEADAALYRGKASGRNRVERQEESTPVVAPAARAPRAV